MLKDEGKAQMHDAKFEFLYKKDERRAQISSVWRKLLYEIHLRFVTTFTNPHPPLAKCNAWAFCLPFIPA
jgi:hypothetical protein